MKAKRVAGFALLALAGAVLFGVICWSVGWRAALGVCAFSIGVTALVVLGLEWTVE